MVLFTSVSSYAQNSVFAEGPWVKIGIEENSIIKITYNELSATGLPVAGATPESIRVFGHGSGMLPQENDSLVNLDPPEIAISVITSQPGVFQPGDYILFYAEGPDYIRFNREEAKINYQNHLSADENYYFLTIDQGSGKRIPKETSTAAGPILTRGIQHIIHEEELHNILHSGRTWYGEKFDLTTNRSFEVSMPNIVANSEIKIFSSVLSASTEVSTFNVSLNNIPIGSQELAPIPKTTPTFDATYARKGTPAQDWFSASQAAIGEQISSVNYSYDKTTGLGYLDYFMLQAETELVYTGSPLGFFTGNYNLGENRTVQVSNSPNELVALDITDPLNPVELNVVVMNGMANFNIAAETESIIAFDPTALSQAGTFSTMTNQNLKAVSQAELLIVTNPEFIQSAQQIADLRIQEGIATVVVSDQEIYNEFSSGKKDITAIRNYARFLYNNAGLKHLLLLGKGTYDPKNVLESGMEKLPIYQSRNSIYPLLTYSSDDYLAFMEDHEGYWAEDASDDHTMDIGVGRIPVTSQEEAGIYLDKLKAYSSKAALGNWRQKVVFVAENGDRNIHQRDAERLSTLIDTTYEAFTTKKIYIDAYPIQVNPGSIRAPEANKDLYESINAGALIVNYTGHGSEEQWANTRIFDTRVIDSLLNDKHLPLFVTATCEFGRHDDTGRKSGGEDLLLLKRTGGIATITTSRPVYANSNYRLNTAFYNAVFEKINGSYQQLGDIIRETKNNSLNGVQNRNFILLGDPSMTLSYGEQVISLDSLNGESIVLNDTLGALEPLNFTGSIRQSNQVIDDSFNGTADIKIFDRSREKLTLGNKIGNDPGNPFSYSVRDNVLFTGSATITNGIFEFETILPKDISYKPESARVVIYASRADSTSDATGANIDLLIGSSSGNTIVDNEPPEINIYIGDTLFASGDIVNSSSLLVVKLTDDYGINTSLSQVGHSITYQLDDQEPYVLNEYFNTITDDFRTGWIYFNLPKMAAGRHTIKVTAWDTSNNSSTEEIEFRVMGNNQVVISNLSNYPNPMRESTMITFNHNLGGEDIEVRLEIINTSGQKVYSETRNYDAAPGTINDWYWDGRNHDGGKLISGLYIYGVFLRSISSGVVQQQFSRLFISN